MDKKTNDKIFEVRKSLIDKFSSWETRGFYAFMAFFAFLLPIIISNLENLKVYMHLSANWVISIYLIIAIGFLVYMEFLSWRRINKMHKELIDDLKQNKLDNTKNLTWRRYRRF